MVILTSLNLLSGTQGKKFEKGCTSGTSRVLTVGLLQQLNMEALIAASADYEVRSLKTFSNAQGITPIETHCQLYSVYGHNVMSKRMVRRWCRQVAASRQHVYHG